VTEPSAATASLRRGAGTHGADGADEAVTTVDISPGGATGPLRGRPRRGRLAVVALVLVGAFATLLVLGLGSSLNYFETVDQAVAHRAALGASTFRLEGVVLPGTVRRDGGVVAFTIAGTRHRVAVVNSGSPPQLFQPDIPVVVLGHFDHATFVSHQVIVDHSAQYVEQHPERVKAPNGTTR
jgi:cytochrome c-type biogenesis protein CcmE